MIYCHNESIYRAYRQLQAERYRYRLCFMFREQKESGIGEQGRSGEYRTEGKGVISGQEGEYGCGSREKV